MAKKKSALTAIEDMQSVLRVKFVGLSELMFNRFTTIEEADTKPLEDKMYFDEKGLMFMPANNIIAFLGARQKSCAAKFKGMKREPYCQGILANVMVNPTAIPITRNGKRIKFTKFKNNEDKKAGIYGAYHKAIVKKTGGGYVPILTHRPVIKLPWEMEFETSLWENDDDITVDLLTAWYIKGGLSVAVGSYRPAFGRFMATVTQMR